MKITLKVRLINIVYTYWSLSGKVFTTSRNSRNQSWLHLALRGNYETIRLVFNVDNSPVVMGHSVASGPSTESNCRVSSEDRHSGKRINNRLSPIFSRISSTTSNLAAALGFMQHRKYVKPIFAQLTFHNVYRQKGIT